MSKNGKREFGEGKIGESFRSPITQGSTDNVQNKLHYLQYLQALNEVGEKKIKIDGDDGVLIRDVIGDFSRYDKIKMRTIAVLNKLSSEAPADFEELCVDYGVADGDLFRLAEVLTQISLRKEKEESMFAMIMTDANKIRKSDKDKVVDTLKTDKAIKTRTTGRRDKVFTE